MTGHDGLKYALYGIERVKKATDEEYYAARQALSQPVLASLHDWMEALLPRVLPKSVLGVALNYLNNYWNQLIRYIER